MLDIKCDSLVTSSAGPETAILSLTSSVTDSWMMVVLEE